MEKENPQAALGQLLALASSNGYVTFDDIMRLADEFSLSIGDVDWLTYTAGSRNIIIYDEAPSSIDSDNDDYDDFAQIDYERTFVEAIEMCPALENLINSIRSIMPPQRGEVKRLKYQANEGNAHARERLIEMYLRLAVRIAVSRAKAFDCDIEETIGDAFVGLINAVNKYDPDYSGPFTSFASLWIFQGISREQGTKNPNIYFPIHKKEGYYTMYPLLKARGCLECDEILKCEKVIDMVSEKLQCERGQVSDVLLAAIPSLSLDQLLEENPENPQFAYTDDEMMGGLEPKLRQEEVRQLLSHLSEKQRAVLIDRYGLDDGVAKTLEEVGQKFGVTRERIRQIESAAIRKIIAHYTGFFKPAMRQDKYKKPSKAYIESQKDRGRSSV